MKHLSALISGIWLSLMLVGAPMQPAYAWFPIDHDIVGSWQGTLTVPGGQLRVVFHIKSVDDGTLTATLDSPNQGAFGIPVSKVTVAGDTLRMEVQAVGGLFEGTIRADDSVIDGTWSQGGASLPLVLERTDETSQMQRPQEPEPPFPYEAEEVVFENTNAGHSLAGTLTLPRDAGPHPAVVLISGSGPQDRDEAIFGHKPFLVLADHLTRRGIAVLRYDDRGTGASGGDFGAATTEDLAGDARAAVSYLASRADIDAAQIGLVGHSEGGLIAPMVANQTDDVAFVVLVAGPAVPGEEILYEQASLINRAAGMSEAEIAENRAQQEQVFAILRDEPDDEAALEKLRALVREGIASLPEEERTQQGVTDENLEAIADRQARSVVSPWMRMFLLYDPRPALRDLDVPVLAVFGEKDLQVPPSQSATEMEAALEAAPTEDYEVVVLPGLNHLMQPARTGAPSEYGEIEQTMAPAALEQISRWIVKQTG